MTEYSIIIPTLNRCKYLKQTLESIKLQERLEQFEVIIVDNGSDDNTLNIFLEFVVSEPNLKMTYLNDRTPGLLTGRHLGAFNAKGNVLCYLDDDIILSEYWTKAIIEGFEGNEEIGLLTGPSFPNYEQAPPEWLKCFWYEINSNERFCAPLSLLDLGNEKKYINPNFVWGLNFSIRKEVFYFLKGFNPDNIPSKFQMFQGDGETGLTMKALDFSIKALYHPLALVLHQIPKERLTKEYFGKRFFYQGICDSYTLLRKENESLKSKKRNLNWKGHVYQYVVNKIKNVWLNYISILKWYKISREAYNIKRYSGKMYRNGFKYHQEKFTNSEKVRKWVIKTDYFDYKLPEYD